MVEASKVKSVENSTTLPAFLRYEVYFNNDNYIDQARHLFSPYALYLINHGT